MTKQLEALIAEMKAAAEKATPLQLDTAQIVRGNGGSLECPCCEGAGYVEEENDFCNIDGEPLGVQFYGIGSSFGLAEEYFRQVSPANIKALIAALEQAQQEHRLHAARLIGDKALLKECIAALEASPVAVKLPKKNIGWDRDGDDCWNNAIDACAEAIRAAGGKVEGE